MSLNAKLTKTHQSLLARSIGRLSFIEKITLLIGLCIGAAFIVFSIFYRSPPYFSVKLADIPEQEFRAIIRGDNAYLVTKVKHELIDTKDMPLHVKTTDKLFTYFVFVVDSQYGHILLPYKNHRYQSVSCPRLIMELTGFKYGGRFLESGIRCLAPKERWKQDTFVYKLNGKSHNKFIADLYPPIFKVKDRTLRISI